jgi:hypothetical protein
MCVQATVPGFEIGTKLIGGFDSFFLGNYLLVQPDRYLPQYFESYECPVRNNAPLGFESQQLEFLTG